MPDENAPLPPYWLKVDADGDAWLVDHAEYVIVDYDGEPRWDVDNDGSGGRDVWSNISPNLPVKLWSMSEEGMRAAHMWAIMTWPTYLDRPSTAQGDVILRRRAWSEMARSLAHPIAEE